jgi:type III secretion system PrgH/EprH family protein
VQPLILKILSGPMYGVELDLPPGPLRLIVGRIASSDDVAHVGERAGDVLFVPASRDIGVVRLEPAAGDDVPADCPLRATLSNETEVDSVPVPMQQPVLLSGFAFAIKRAGDVWSEEITSYVPGADTTASGAPPGKRGGKLINGKLIAGVSLVVLSALAAGLYMFIHERELRTVSAIVAPTGAVVLKPVAGRITVAAPDHDTADAARRLLRQNEQGGSTDVIDMRRETGRLAALLDEQGYAFFVVRFDAPDEIRIVASAERASRAPSYIEGLRKTVQAAFPYLRAVRFEHVSDQRVESDAQHAMMRAAVPYRRVVAGDGIVYRVDSTLGDRQLSDLSQAVRDFYALWGERYLRFAVRLSEDPLAGKTFMTGDAGYQVDRNRHWIYMDSGRAPTQRNSALQ